MNRRLPEGDGSSRTGVAKHARDYARLVVKKKKMEADLKQVGASMKKLEQPVMDHFQQMGCTKTTIDGVTLYIKRRLAVNKKPEATPEALSEALHKVGMGDYVKASVNANSLASYYKSLEEELGPEHLNSIENLLQEEVRDVLNIHEIFTIGARQS